MTTIYDRLGGQGAIDAAVPLLYQKVQADDRINYFFEGVNAERQTGMLNAFLTMGFGGPNNYTGKDMRQAHSHLIARGLNDSHFDALGEQINATLVELNVPPELIAGVLAVAETLRADVLSK